MTTKLTRAMCLPMLCVASCGPLASRVAAADTKKGQRDRCRRRGRRASMHCLPRQPRQGPAGFRYPASRWSRCRLSPEPACRLPQLPWAKGRRRRAGRRDAAAASNQRQARDLLGQRARAGAVERPPRHVDAGLARPVEAGTRRRDRLRAERPCTRRAGRAAQGRRRRADDEVARGATVFAEGCAACHGIGGSGDGPVAHLFLPRPADLIDIKPNRARVLQVLAQGVPGASMPIFSDLSPTDQTAVAAYVETLYGSRRTKGP